MDSLLSEETLCVNTFFFTKKMKKKIYLEITVLQLSSYTYLSFQIYRVSASKFIITPLQCSDKAQYTYLDIKVLKVMSAQIVSANIGENVHRKYSLRKNICCEKVSRPQHIFILKRVHMGYAY